MASPSKMKGRTADEIHKDYDGFVEKFKPKKTTDDCYTPAPIYEAICQWVNDNIIDLTNKPIVRPFYPGGDYENFDYPDGCIVLDNPPFSILSKIRRFYHKRGIRYFLFAPTLTLANSAKELDCTYIIGRSIIYENKATVATSFITNLDCEGIGIWVAGDLCDAIKEANSKRATVQLPKIKYPGNVATAAILNKIAQRGVTLKISKSDRTPISRLDSQRETGKGLFGGGWLLSDRAAADLAAADLAAADRAAARTEIEFPLSERELQIIKSLG